MVIQYASRNKFAGLILANIHTFTSYCELQYSSLTNHSCCRVNSPMCVGEGDVSALYEGDSTTVKPWICKQLLFYPFLLFCLQVICQRAMWHISGSRTRQKSKHCFCLVFRSYNEIGVPDSFKRFRSTPFWKKLETIDSTAPAVCGFSDQPTSATLVQRKLFMAQHGTRSGLMQKKVHQSTCYIYF